MTRGKRTRAAIVGSQRASAAATRLGEELRKSRQRRRLTQAALARIVGISRQRIGDLENGRGEAAPADTWFALAGALERYLRFEFARDPLTELADAGHLLVQELVIRLARAASWEVSFEAHSSVTSDRSIDVRLIDRRRRRLAIVECWNTFGDLGAATRSSNRKQQEAEAMAVAIAGDGEPFAVSLCWVIRDTKANRELINMYGQIFATRFSGSSADWVKALTVPLARMPAKPGLVWCDTRATRLFAHRKGRNR